MTLARAGIAWALIGAILGTIVAFLVNLLASRFGLGLGVFGGVLAVGVISASGGVGGAIGWGLLNARSRGRYWIAPLVAIVAAGFLLAATLPFLGADVVAQATGGATSEALRRAEESVRGGRMPTGSDALDSAKQVGIYVARGLVAPIVSLASLVVAPIAALSVALRRV